MTDTTTTPHATDLAQRFLAAANAIGDALDATDRALRDPALPLKDEEANIERVLMDGEAVMAALRALAMRCDRAAVANAPERRRGGIPDYRKVQMADANHIWLNAFSCIRPTDAFAADLGRVILRKLNDRALLLHDPDTLADLLYLSVNKS